MTHNAAQPDGAAPVEETLDPQDWEEVRRLGRQMVDDMIDYMQSVRERPAWRSPSGAAREALLQAVPRAGTPLAEVYEDFKAHILPFPTGNQHPGFFGWVMGNGTATGMLADMLASGLNPHLAGYDQSAALVEREVIRWLSDLMGFPPTASGVLVSGGTMANLNGLAVARNVKCGFDIREMGLNNAAAPKLRVYGSVETHSWIYKTCELLGLGRKAFRAIAVDKNYGIDIAACRAAIEADLRAGEKPFCIVGNVGTVNTAAIDDIEALRRLADAFDLWLHVDGAFGSLAALCPQPLPRVTAQALADSIAFDLHKWGYMPYEVGCILVKDGHTQTATFGQTPSYLTSQKRGLSVDTTYFADRGLQLSRGFRALKVWMSFKEQGADKIGRLIQQNIEQARYLEGLVRDHPELELLAPVCLNIVCLRFIDASMSPASLNQLNEEVLLRIQESGRFVPSHTVLDSKFAIRICITNHRSRNADFDDLVEEIVRHAHAARRSLSSEHA